MLCLCFNSFLDLSLCLFGISVSIIKVEKFRLRLKLAFYIDLLTLAHVYLSRSFLHVFIYLVSAFTFINFLCVLSSSRIPLIKSFPCFFFTYLKILFQLFNLITQSRTRSLNIVSIWRKSIYKIVLIYLFKNVFSVYDFQRPSSKQKFSF